MVLGMSTHSEVPAKDGAARRLLDAEEVGRWIGVPTPYVYALARRKAIPTVRVGERYVRFRAEAVAAWIEAQESPARGWN